MELGAICSPSPAFICSLTPSLVEHLQYVRHYAVERGGNTVPTFTKACSFMGNAMGGQYGNGKIPRNNENIIKSLSPAVGGRNIDTWGLGNIRGTQS